MKLTNEVKIWKKKKGSPSITTDLRKHYVAVPEIIDTASGIIINGKRFRSLIFTTDIAIIMNNDADAVIAVYPFSPHPAIIQGITTVASMPVLAGVGGGITNGHRSANIALFAESHGCIGVVLNSPTPKETYQEIDRLVDIPIISTVVSEFTDIQGKLDAGVDILNVSGAARTTHIVREIRKKFPKVPIIATGGPTEESIKATIAAGANAITYTPPSNGKLFSELMKKYRNQEETLYEVQQESEEEK
ncbi:hydrolase [Carnobacterium jeotgali]|uniref:hydrolase n=1 Tax=Carnobacterium jeotgali TaxID=545534 RepID=UPI0004937397|nr:hydrolase [Carnobacterium jeotgali]